MMKSGQISSKFIKAEFVLDRSKADLMGVPPDWEPVTVDPDEVLLRRDQSPYMTFAQMAEMEPLEIDLTLQSMSDLDGVRDIREYGEGYCWEDPTYGVLPIETVRIHYELELITIEALSLGSAFAKSFLKDLKEGRLRKFSPDGGPAEFLPRMGHAPDSQPEFNPSER